MVKSMAPPAHATATSSQRSASQRNASHPYGATPSASGSGLSNNRVFASVSDNQSAVGSHNTSIGNAANKYK
jgi:hypothetical protein